MERIEGERARVTAKVGLRERAFLRVRGVEEL
jgi:hypothetical protein